MARHVEQLGSGLGQETGVLTGHQHLGQNVEQLPAETLRGNQLVELLHHRGRVVLRLGVDGQHAAGITDTQHFLAGEAPVDVAGQCGQVLDVAHMLLIVENGLVEVGDAPAEGNVVHEEVRQRSRGLGRVGVAPGAEGHQNLVVLVEGHVAVHHGAHADAGQNLYLSVILLAYVGAKVGVAVLQSVQNGFDAVGPEAVDELVLPFVAALGYRLVLLVDENGLDAGGAEFYT